MSEHRSPGRLVRQLRPKADPARWERQFLVKTFCSKHPQCCLFDLACYRLLVGKEKEHWPKAELQAAEDLILAQLADRRCPDPAKQRYAVTAARNLRQDRVEQELQ